MWAYEIRKHRKHALYVNGYYLTVALYMCSWQYLPLLTLLRHHF